jgi:hypothetical protein
MVGLRPPRQVSQRFGDITLRDSHGVVGYFDGATFDNASVSLFSHRGMSYTKPRYLRRRHMCGTVKQTTPMQMRTRSWTKPSSPSTSDTTTYMFDGRFGIWTKTQGSGSSLNTATSAAGKPHRHQPCCCSPVRGARGNRFSPASLPSIRHPRVPCATSSSARGQHPRLWQCPLCYTSGSTKDEI